MAWTPGADAPSDAVWMVELRTPDQKLRSLTTSDLSMALSAFHLDRDNLMIFATALAVELLPDPAGPSMAIIILFVLIFKLIIN